MTTIALVMDLKTDIFDGRHVQFTLVVVILENLKSVVIELLNVERRCSSIASGMQPTVINVAWHYWLELPHFRRLENSALKFSSWIVSAIHLDDRVEVCVFRIIRELFLLLFVLVNAVENVLGVAARARVYLKGLYFTLSSFASWWLIAGLVESAVFLVSHFNPT